MSEVEPTIGQWQAECREIGMLEFSPSDAVSELLPHWQLPAGAAFLGVVESDALCLLEDGSLCVFDHEVAERVLCAAAPNQRQLISALQAMDEYFDRCAENDALANDESAAVEIREKCTALVGGADFASFIQLFFWA